MTIHTLTAGMLWPLLAVAAVAAAVLAAWALRRLARTVRGSEVEPHHLVMLAVGLGSIAMAGYGVVTFLLAAAGFPWPLAAAGTVAFEGGMLSAEWSAWQSIRRRRPTRTAAMYRRAAWACVAASAAANALHAPVAGGLGTVLFAGLPVLGAALVEIVERDLLHGQATADEDTARPGPASIVAAAWRRVWAAAAVRVGATIDTDLTDLARRTRADRAARAMVRVTRARARRHLPRWWVDRLERRAAAAMQRADVGTDYRQGARMAAQVHLWVTTGTLADSEVWRDVDRATKRVVEVASIPARAESAQLEAATGTATDTGAGGATDGTTTGAQPPQLDGAPRGRNSTATDRPARRASRHASETGDAASRMRKYWDAERADGRTPSGAELGRVGGTTAQYGRKLRAAWTASGTATGALPGVPATDGTTTGAQPPQPDTATEWRAWDADAAQLETATDGHTAAGEGR